MNSIKMSVDELLKEWSESEPERCRSTDDLPGVYVIECNRYVQAIADSVPAEDAAVLQRSLQEACEARKWDWQVRHHPGRRKELQYVASIDSDGQVFRVFTEHSSPEAALLSAYLKACKVPKIGIF